MTKDEALKLALEALEIVNREMLTLRDELAERGGRPSQGYHQLLWDSSHKVYTDTAIPAAEAIREALAQPEQEPVAVARVDDLERGGRVRALAMNLSLDAPLYTSPPPQRKPLTDEEILTVAKNHYNSHQRAEISFARAIEAAHGIKE